MSSSRRDTASIGEPRAAGAAYGLAHCLNYLLLDRSTVDRRFVFEACNNRLGVTFTTVKQEQAVFAVSEFVSERGHVPAAGEWDAFRHETGREQYPSATFVRNAFGNDWDQVRAAFGEPVGLDILSRRLTAHGRRSQEEDLLAVLEHWASIKEGDLWQREFITWCAREREQPRPCLPGIPQSWSPFRRLFGTWEKALIRIGEQARKGAGDPPPRAPAASDDAHDHVFFVWAAQQTGALALAEFERWLGDDAQHLSLGLDPMPTTYSPWRERFGGFDKVLTRLGLTHRGKVAAHLKQGLTDEVRCPTPPADLGDDLWWVSEAAREHGPLMPYRAYSEQRRLWLGAAARDGMEPPRIPGAGELMHVHGGWIATKTAAGVLPPEAAQEARHGLRYPSVVLRRQLADALIDASGRLSPEGYSKWARRQRKLLSSAGKDARIAGKETMLGRFGGPDRDDWDLVLKQGIRACADLGVSFDASATT